MPPGARATAPAPRPARPEAPVRALLGAFCVLTAAAVVSLVVLAGDTERTFAWTIEPPVTAAFLGSGYGAGLVLSVLSLRSDDWGAVRVPFATVLVFTWLTAVATFVHLDRMHVVTPGEGPVARPAAWLWLAVYVVIPVGMAVLWPRQPHPPRARRGGRGAAVRPLPRAPIPRWLTVALLAQGAVLAVVGAALFVAPSTAATLWPWPLTPLTARVVAAWLLAFAVAAVMCVRDGDLARLRIATVAYAAFGLLQGVTAVRFAADVDWGTARAVAWLAMVGVVVATGVTGSLLAGRRRDVRTAVGVRA
jgi:hypothetical protein